MVGMDRKVYIAGIIIFMVLLNVMALSIHPVLSGEPSNTSKSGLSKTSPWPMYGQNLRHTGLSPYPTDTNAGDKLWNYTTGYWIVSSPVVDSDGTIYFGSWDWYFYALNSDGTLKWKVAVGGKVYSSPALDDNGTIYVATYDSQKVYAIYTSNGTVKWQFSLAEPNEYSSPAIGDDGTIYVGCGGDNSNYGYMYAINPDGTQKWRYQANYVVWSSPAIYGGNVYFGSSSENSYEGYFYAVKEDGTLNWSYRVNDDIISSPAVGEDGTIYVGSVDKTFYAFNPDGTLKWSYDTGDNGEPSGYFRYSRPAINSSGVILTGNSNGYLYAFNPDGTVNWMLNIGSEVYSPSIGRNDIVYVGSSDYKLYSVNPDGTVRWTFSTGGAITAAPTIGKDGIIYVGSHDKNLYAIGTSAVPELGNLVFLSPLLVIAVIALRKRN